MAGWGRRHGLAAACFFLPLLSARAPESATARGAFAHTAVVYTLWKGTDPALAHGAFRDFDRSLRGSMHLWSSVAAFVVWGSTCDTLINAKGRTWSRPCTPFDLGSAPSSSSCALSAPRVHVGELYASDVGYNTSELYRTVHPCTCRFYLYQPLLALGIKRALYLDTDTLPLDYGALNLFTQSIDNRLVVLARRCSYRFADRMNFSHPLVWSSRKEQTFNNGVFGFADTVGWCQRWNAYYEERTLRRYARVDGVGPPLGGRARATPP